MKTIGLYYPVCALIALTSIFPALAGCSQDRAKASLTPPPLPAVTVSKPLQKPVTHYADFTGITEARELVTIRARVEGVLEKIYFTPGALVEKGDLLYAIE